MHQVHLNDSLYEQAKRRTTEAGYKTVDEYIAQVVTADLGDSEDNFDYLFTPEVIQELERISVAVDSGGKTYTTDEVNEHFRKKSEAWRKDHAS